MREIKFKFYCVASCSFSKTFTIEELANGLYDFHCDIDKALKLQYTGSKDKNEVEIYEGDIIEYMTGQLKHIPTKHKVTWLKDEARFSFGCKANTQYMFYNTVVIGNIYENPELIQGD